MYVIIVKSPHTVQLVVCLSQIITKCLCYLVDSKKTRNV